MGFIRSLTFLADLTSNVNVLNLKGKGNNISHLVGHTEGVHKRLKLFEDALQKNDMTHFTSCQELKENENDFIDFAEFKEVISEISEEFCIRFNDSDSLKPKLQLFNNPMDTEVTQQPFDLQMELCDLQSDPFLQLKKLISRRFFGKCCLK
jgi:hypothetical protein